MSKKITPQAAAAVVAVVLAIVLALGAFWYRNSSGEAAADEMHAAMKKTIPGQSPFTKEQRAEMDRQGKK